MNMKGVAGNVARGVSSTAILLLLLVLLSHSTLAATYTTEQSDTTITGTLSTTTYNLQSGTFTASGNYDIHTITAYLKDTGATTQTYVNLSLWTESGDLPNTLIAYSNYTLPVTSLTGSFVPYNFTFASPISVSNGTKYVIVLATDAAENPGVNYAYSNVAGVRGRSALPVSWSISSSVQRVPHIIYSCSGADCFGGSVSNVTIKATDFYTAAQVNNFFVDIGGNTYNTTTGTLTLPILTNTTQLWNLSVYANNYFKNTSLNVNLSTIPYTSTIIPYTKVFALNGNTNASIQNFTISWNNTNYTTTTYNASIPLYSVTNTNLTFTSPNYNGDSVLVNASPYLENYTFYVYPYPSSVTVRVYSQDDGSLITENITLVVSGSSFEDTFYTTTGKYFIGNLTGGIHTFKFSGANYTTQTYTITIGDNTHQTLNAFLAANTSEVTFTVQNSDSNIEVEDVDVAQQRLVSNVWTTVSSKQTDISGRVQFQYVPDVKYRFIVSKTGYETKTFTLDPVIFNSYTILINKIVTQQDETIFSGISWSFAPTEFQSNNTYLLEFTIFSPDGALESYGFSVSEPSGNTAGDTGINAYGSTLSDTIDVNASTYEDTVNLTFWYDTTFTNNRTYTRFYSIELNISDGTFADLRDTDFGLTTFEKVLIATICIIILSGFAFMFGGPLGGGIIALFLLGWFYYIGFLTLWMILPSALAGIMLIFWRSSN